MILFNTCRVREQAENKTYSALGRLRSFKKQHPEKIIGVMGCMAQKDQQLVFEPGAVCRSGRRSRPARTRFPT